MKQQMSTEQIQLTAINALQLPDLRSAHADLNEAALSEFHAPLAATITHVRELGSAQLIVRRASLERSDDFEKRVQSFFRELLDTMQLPGERIGFEVKIGEKAGLIVVTLFKEEPNT